MAISIPLDPGRAAGVALASGRPSGRSVCEAGRVFLAEEAASLLTWPSKSKSCMRRPLQHETGELGELRVAQCFIEHGWIVNKLHSDYGFDYLVQPVDGQVVLPQFALIQVKSVRSRHRSGGVRVSAKHMELWHSCPIPCFLVIVDLLDGCIHIRDAKAILHSPDGMEETTDIKHSYTFRFPTVPVSVAQQIDEMRQMVGKYWWKVALMTFGGGADVDLPRHYWIRAKDMATLRSELRPLIGEELAEKVRYEDEPES